MNTPSRPAPVRLVSVRAAAAYLGLSHRTVRRWVSDGRIPGYAVGGSIRVSMVDVEALPQLIPTAADR